MTDPEDVTDLERERRIRRKVRSLGEDIEAAGEVDEFADDPEGYLKQKVVDVDGNSKQLYSVADVAELFEVDPESVRRWIRSGDLSASKVGRGYRISRSDLENYYRNEGGDRLFGKSVPMRELETRLEREFPTRTTREPYYIKAFPGPNEQIVAVELCGERTFCRFHPDEDPDAVLEDTIRRVRADILDTEDPE